MPVKLFLEKHRDVPRFPCVGASRLSLAAAQGRVQCWGALGHHEQPGWVLEAG